MKRIIFAVIVAAVFWFVMFSPWTRDYVNFWVTMACAGIILILMSVFWGKDFINQFSFSVKDITYRIYDYNRKDAEGNPRELHTELAKDAIDYTVYDSYKTEYVPSPNRPVQLVKCPYFTTNLLEMNQTLTRLYHQLDSFVIYICIEGKSTIKDNKGNTLSLHQGESLLIPADTNAVELIPSTYTKILETYVE
jgi:hypothetical protein